MHVDWLRWFEALKKRIDGGVVIFAEQIAGGQPLTRVNDTNVTATLTGTPATALLKAVTITLGWTGTLGLARGGTAADLSATGGTAQYLKQASVGAAITVGTIPASDIASPGALTRVNDTNVTLTLGGSPTVALLAATSLTLGWTGTLGVARGGTNLASYAIGDLLYASGATTLSKLADVTSGSYLRSGGVTTAPVWSTLTLPNAATTGDLLYASAANTLIVRAIGSTADVLTVTGGVPVWAAPAAAGTSVIVNDTTTNATMFPVWVTANSGSLPLKVSSTKLSWNPSTGVLALATPLVVTSGGTGTGTAFTAGSVVFAGASGVYSQDNANLFWDDTNNRLGIGIVTPQSTLHLVNATSGIQALRLVGAASQAAAMFAVQDSSPTTLIQINADGTVQGGNGHLKMDNSNGTVLDYNTATAWQLAGSFANLLVGAVNYRFNATGFGLGLTTVTAYLHIKAGTTAASTAPLKFTSGPLLTTAEAGAVEFLTDAFYGTITTGAARKTFAFLEAPVFTTWSSSGKLTSYNGIATAGWGIPVVQGAGRSIAQVAAVASVAAYTLTAADASFRVSANVNVTTSTTYNFTVAVDYTDETNTAQTLTLTFSQLAGVFVTAITNVTGAGPYEGIPLHIRCKASTAITIKTIGTFTVVTYNVEGLIQQVA